MVLAAVSVKTNVLLPIITGLFQGSIYGLIALGIVLLYKSNRIFNFAQGEFGSIAALTANAGLIGSFGFTMPYWVAMLAGLLAGTLAAVVTERVVIRPLFNRPKVELTVATVGVALTFIAVETLLVRQLSNFPSFSSTITSLSRKPYWFQVFGRGISYEEVLAVVVLLLLAIAVGIFFKTTNTGIAILAVSQESTASSLVGISIGRISLVTWAMAGFMGSMGGLLLSQFTNVASPGYVTGTALFTGVTAAVLGGVTSMSGAFVGGIAVGILEKLSNPENLTAFGLPNIPGLDQVVVGLALLIILLVRPRGLLGKET